MKPTSAYSLAFRTVFFFLLLTLSLRVHVYADTGTVKYINSLFKQQGLPPPPPLPEEDLAHISKPGIVRIANHYVGTTTFVINFIVDFKHLELIPAIPAKPVDIVFDEKITGTGFIITTDGYIVTNAHVATAKQHKISDNIAATRTKLVFMSALSLSAADSGAFIDLTKTSEGAEKIKKFGEEISKRILANSTTTFQESVTVLNPLSTKNTIDEIIANGFPAKVIATGDGDYTINQKDVAVIKIDKGSLPAIPFASENDQALIVGQKIYAFGFPGNADISKTIGRDFLEPTFTNGVISAFKDSDAKDFKIIQTNANISQGSSGSPVLNAKGEIVGIMTYVTGGDGGGGFSFAIPASIIKDVITKAKITPVTGDIYTHFNNGRTLQSQMHCDAATKEFIATRNTDTSFPLEDDFLTSYIKQCETMKTAGLSVDSDMDQLHLNLKPWMTTIYVSVGGAVIVIVLGVILFLVMRRMKKDEAKMDELVKQSHVGSETPTGTPVTPVPPVAPVSTPPVVPTVTLGQPPAPVAGVL